MGLSRYEALKIMGLEEGCTTKDVRDRFKKLALKWHPDKNIDNPEDAQKKFQAISAAYTKLVSAEEENDDIPTDTLREMFAEIWQSHNNRDSFTSQPHLFCDCDQCRADWEDISLDDFIGSDSDPDDDFYYDDTLYADDLLKQFGDKLYRKFNGPGRAEKKAKQNSLSGSHYRENLTAEEALRNADELLEAEEREKRQAEKKKKRNRKKKESKKRRKAKSSEDDGTEDGNMEEDDRDSEDTQPAAEVVVEEEKQIDKNKEQKKSEETANVKTKTEHNKHYKKKPEENRRHHNITAVKQKTGTDVVSGKTEVSNDRLNDEEEDSLPSEDELDLGSAFVRHAKTSAEARSRPTKPKEKPPPPSSITDKHNEPQQTQHKPNSKGQKSNPSKSDSSGHSESQTTLKHKPNNQYHQIKNTTRTVNKGSNRPKVAVGINGSAPVISNSNGHGGSTVIEQKEEEREEDDDDDDDLTPVDKSEARHYEANIPQSKLLAGEGNRAAKAGEFEAAVQKYSAAIKLYPFDHRYFGNRSFCYDYLQEYSKALADANSALRIDITWAKGFYRRGRGLAGLKKHEAAVAAFSRALELNPEYIEAREQLDVVQLEQLQGMGFPVEASRVALAEYHTVAAAVDAMVNRTGGDGEGTHKKQRATNSSAENYKPVYNHSGFEIPPRMLPQTAPPENCALWVGNINSKALTQSKLINLFQRYGTVSSVRVLYEKRCAFINYSRPESAANALKKLQGYNIAGCCLLVRYPENSTQTPPVLKQKKTSSNDDEECHYWRSYGCSFGDQCRYLHVPENKGIDADYTDIPSQ